VLSAQESLGEDEKVHDKAGRKCEQQEQECPVKIRVKTVNSKNKSVL